MNGNEENCKETCKEHKGCKEFKRRQVLNWISPVKDKYKRNTSSGVTIR